MEKKERYLAYTGFSIEHELRNYPDMPENRGAEINVIYLGYLTKEHCRSLSVFTNKGYGSGGRKRVYIRSYDKLKGGNRLLADTKIRQWDKLPDNISIGKELRKMHEAAKLLQEATHSLEQSTPADVTIVGSFKQAEQLIQSQVNKVEDFYFSMTGENEMQFTDKFRMKVKGIIRKYGVDEVLITAQEIVNKYGKDGLDKLITYTNARHNPVSIAKYICGIMKNKIWAPKRPPAWAMGNGTKELDYVVEIVSELMSIGGRKCLDYVTELVKYRSYESYDDCVAMIDSEGKQWAYSAHAGSPRMIQAASGVCVPDTIDSYQADIEDSDGTVPNVNVSNLYADMLRALTDSNNPDEKYRHWAKWKSGVGCTDIAKSENPEWESEYGREEAQRLWTSEADKIRKQVERFDKQLARQPSTQNERKTS